MFNRIKIILAERFVSFCQDFFDFYTLLSLSIASAAGFCFQSKYIARSTSSFRLGQIVAVLGCIGLTVVVKKSLERAKDIHGYAQALSYIIPVVAGAIIIVVLVIDADMSNSAIEDEKIFNVSDRVDARIDTSALAGWRSDLAFYRGEVQYYKNLEIVEKRSYRTKKAQMQTKADEYNRLIKDLQDKVYETKSESTDLRKSTVTDAEGKTRNSYLGIWLLLISVTIELVAHRLKPFQPGVSAEFQAQDLGDVATFKTSETTHREFSVTIWSKDAKGFENAMIALAKEIRGGNGKGLMTKTASYFGCNKGQVSRAVEQAINGQVITVPKFLLPLPASKDMS